MYYIKFLIISFSLLMSLLIKSQEINIYDNAYASVVAIFGDEAIGSGVIISSSGYVLTNWHVVENNPNLKVLTIGEGGFEENLREVEVIKYNAISDLALIKITSQPDNMSVASISQIIPKIGEAVHAIGHPNGEIWSYSKGYISAIRDDYSWKTEAAQFKGDVYQMQTPINPGNSGGPLLNNFGNVVGINTFMDTESQGITYAVTVTEIIKFLGS